MCARSRHCCAHATWGAGTASRPGTFTQATAARAARSSTRARCASYTQRLPSLTATAAHRAAPVGGARRESSHGATLGAVRQTQPPPPTALARASILGPCCALPRRAAVAEAPHNAPPPRNAARGRAGGATGGTALPLWRGTVCAARFTSWRRARAWPRASPGAGPAHRAQRELPFVSVRPQVLPSPLLRGVLTTKRP
jgi:hypothetical protein